MNPACRLLCLGVGLLMACSGGLAVPLFAADSPVKHRLMFAEYGNNRLVELDADGKIVWEHKLPGLAVIFQPLADGHVVYAFGGNPTGVVEIDRDQKTIWKFVSKCPEVLSCERLPDGNTLVAEQGPAKVLEVDSRGQVVREIPLPTSFTQHHLQVRGIHRLPGGNVLAALEGEGVLREVDPLGKTVWEYPKVEHVITGHRFPNGNTLIACGTQKKLIEVDRSGKTVWEFGEQDAPDLNLTWLTSLQVLKNGNYLVGNFVRGAEGKGAHAFEVTRDKKVVWKLTDHDRFKMITTIRALDDLAPERE